MIQNDNGNGSDFHDFESKRQQLFNSLDQAEKGLKGTHLDQSKKVKLGRVNKSHLNQNIIKKFRGKESIFKKPELPLIKCLKPRKTPDYQVNPHKWKKYSLSDVDISDKTNASAAFAFLKEIEIHKDGDKECENIMEIDDNAKPLFNKSVRDKQQLNIEDESEQERPKLKGGKLLMPEYVVGQKSSKEKKKPRGPKCADSGKQLTLSHLLEDE